MLKIYVHDQDKFILEYKEIFKNFSHPKVAIEYGPYRTMVQVLNYYSCEKYRDFDYYQEVNDDHVYVTPDWDIKLMTACAGKNNGVSVAYGVTRQFPGATVHGAKLVHGMGYFFPPEYTHTCVDLWLMDFGFESNIMIYVPDVLIDHMHPIFGKGEWDDSYREGGEDTHPSMKTYQTWQLTNRATDVAKAKKLSADARTYTADNMPTIDENLSVFMLTYGRLKLLENTILSYMFSRPRPKHLYVFDDLGPEKEQVREMLMKIPEVIFIPNDRNYGSDGNIVQAMRKMFEAGAKNIIALDSDCLFAKEWWTKAQEISKSGVLEMATVCLFNARVHPHQPSGIDGLVSKQYIGGLGTMLSMTNWEKYMKVIEKDDLAGWDGKLCTLMSNDGKKVLACSPSYIQHTGGKQGVHAQIDPIECIADDFIGESPNDVDKISRLETPNLYITQKPKQVDLKHPVYLRYLGIYPYSGFDDNGCRQINAKELEIINVSKEKSKQLLRDFPTLWTFIESIIGDNT